MLDYFANLSKGKTALWCYLIWYLVIVCYYFDAALRIWLNSLALSLFVGVALLLSVSTQQGHRSDKWQVFRLFAMPFCVSSFSALIKGQGFIVVMPPKQVEQIVLVGSCSAFILFVFLVKKVRNRPTA
jgi:hypothetical protein